MKLPFSRSGKTEKEAGGRVVMPASRAEQFRKARKKSVFSKVKTNLPKKSGRLSNLTKAQAPKLKRAFRKRNIGIFFLILMLSSSFGAYAYTQKIWIIKDVKVEGDLDILEQDITQLSQKLKGENLLTLDSQNYIRVLAQDPYVQDLFLEKQFPGKLVINVTEAQPYINFYTLNEAYLLGSNGRVLTRRGLEDNYPITEVERLTYLSEKTFRSEQLKDKWLVENLSKQRDLYLEQQEANKKEQQKQEQLAQEPSESEQVLGENAATEQEDFEKFVDKNFQATELVELNKYYAQLRAEVRATIENRWGLLNEKINPEQSELQIYSLVGIEEISDFQGLLSKQYFEQIIARVAGEYIVERVEVVSPVTVKMVAKSVEGDEIIILFSTKKSVDKQFLEFDTVISNLEQNNQKLKKIDLTGEKIVVQYK
jgi:cell division septal protein FtsQ